MAKTEKYSGPFSWTPEELEKYQEQVRRASIKRDLASWMEIRKLKDACKALSADLKKQKTS